MLKNNNSIRKNRPRLLRWGCSLIVLGTLLLSVYLSDPNYYDNTILNPVMKGSMLSSMTDWARLAPIPKAAEDFTITTDGGMFTREFNARFRAPLLDIKQWLDQSPGTSDVVPVEENSAKADMSGGTGSKGLGKSGVWYFEIQPGEGASFSGVWVDVDKEEVRVRTYWS